MKRYFRTIILVLVGALLLASCGAAPASMGEAAMEERVEAPKMEQRAAPQAERRKLLLPRRPRHPRKHPLPKQEPHQQLSLKLRLLPEPSRPNQRRASRQSDRRSRPQARPHSRTTREPRSSLRPATRSRPLVWIPTARRSTWRSTGRVLPTGWSRTRCEPRSGLTRSTTTTRFPSATIALPLPPTSFRHPLDSGLHLARIAFQAADLSYDDTPLNVTLVLDASGSMREGDRVAIAREAAESIRRSLRGQDRIAVVHFTTRVLDNLTVDHRDPDDRAVRRSIDLLAPHGSTNVQAGLDLAVQLADRIRRERPDSYNYIILMSDGVANVDATDPFAILRSADDRDDTNPLRLITIGVGIENYNDYLLEQLAQHGNGWYRYLSSVEQSRATFSRENWLALSIPFADQTRAQVTWDPDMVAVWRIVGYENRATSDESFTEARKEFAEIPAGAATTVFFELQLTDAGRRDTSRLGEVEIRWVTPTTGESNRQHATLLSASEASENARDEAFLRFGGIVALAADRYSNLDYSESPVDRDLAILLEELWSLDRQLGDLNSYKDFSFLLEYLTQTAQKERPSSGYSR